MKTPLTDKLAQTMETHTSPAVDTYARPERTPLFHRSDPRRPMHDDRPMPLSGINRDILRQHLARHGTDLRLGGDRNYFQRGQNFLLFGDQRRPLRRPYVQLRRDAEAPMALHEATHALDPTLARPSQANEVEATGRAEMPAMVAETLSRMRGDQLKADEVPGFLRAHGANPIQEDTNLYRQMVAHGPHIGTPEQQQQFADRVYGYRSDTRVPAPATDDFGARIAHMRETQQRRSPGQRLEVQGQPLRPLRDQYGTGHWNENPAAFTAQLHNVEDWVGALRDPTTNLGRAHDAWSRHNQIYTPRPLTDRINQQE